MRIPYTKDTAPSRRYGIAGCVIALLLIGYHANQASWWLSTTEQTPPQHMLGWVAATIAGALYMLLGTTALMLPIALWIHPWYTRKTDYAFYYSTLQLAVWSIMVELISPLYSAPYNGGAVGIILTSYLSTQIGTRYALYACIVLQLYIIARCMDHTNLYQYLPNVISALQRAYHQSTTQIIHWWRLARITMKHNAPHRANRIQTHDAAQKIINRSEITEPPHFSEQYQLPKLQSIWKDVAPAHTQRSAHNYRSHATILEQKLAQFGIKGSVTSIIVGPVIILFEYQPNSDIPLSKITAREDDLALALQAISLRIIAPIPGRSVVGFECSRQEREMVMFAEHWPALFKESRQLPLLIGVTTQGNPVVLDLALLPHLLVAGATGSGKSVMLHNLLISLLATKTPHELRLILIDPKRLEFAGYTDIAHLLFPIITTPHEAIAALRWAVKEMEQRYELLSQARVTHITSYRATGNALYDIVIIIDEWADLMMSGGKDAELSLVRLTQMARAAGIHLIVATQRPSVDVITGIIKANIPSRIACKVSSKIDSRTILDSGGAERLLGRGDMLVMIGGSSIERMHAAYLSNEEIQTIVCALRRQGAPCYIDSAALHKTNLLQVSPEDTELYNQVLEIIKTMDEVSISALQRRLRIGYNRSARMIDYLEAHGMILPSEGAKARKVLR